MSKDNLVDTAAAPTEAIPDTQTDDEFTEEQIGKSIGPFPEPVTRDVVLKRGLSPAFGRPDRRRSQLVARLKRRRKYANPVKGGTGRHKKGGGGRGHFKA